MLTGSEVSMAHRDRLPTTRTSLAVAAIFLAACWDDGSVKVVIGSPPPTAEKAAEAEPEPSDPKGPAETTMERIPDGPVRGTTHLPDGRVFEAEYGGEGELPTDFPDDVPLYGDAKPMSSVASVESGTVVSMRTQDPADRVFAWYQERYAAQGWEIEHEAVERGRSLIAARKGNRLSSVVITGIPEFTQVMVSVREDR
jgi:hypothetical protein